MEQNLVPSENYQITGVEDGQKHWISRSVAVCVMVYCYGPTPEDPGAFLIHQRGSGCPDEVGKWSVNCGYIGWHESLPAAAVREVYEETGLRLSERQLRSLNYNDTLGGRENVTIRFLAIVSKAEVEGALRTGQINTKSDERGGEKGEVSGFYLLPATPMAIRAFTISNGPMAFGHDKLLEWVIQEKLGK
jgi:8-oxo-dGTP pyrophosphatase MutT (NUDIX family)